MCLVVTAKFCVLLILFLSLLWVWKLKTYSLCWTLSPFRFVSLLLDGIFEKTTSEAKCRFELPARGETKRGRYYATQINLLVVVYLSVHFHKKCYSIMGEKRFIVVYIATKYNNGFCVHIYLNRFLKSTLRVYYRQVSTMFFHFIAFLKVKIPLLTLL